MSIRKIKFRGKEQSISAWAREYGISASTLISRLRRGIPIKDALFMRKNNPLCIKTPAGEYTVNELAKMTGITSAAVYSRHKNRGFKGEEMLLKSLKVKVTAWGRTQSIREWAHETGISTNAIRGRLERGWEPERALSIPTMRQGWRPRGMITAFGRTQMLIEWAREFGINPQTLHARIKRDGLPPEVALRAPVEKKGKRK